ncbi:MAG TPA: virulence protein RhuM/Fic/DOC family protein [Candidatus Portnoybacteria bacterium]|jgi:prophage maintenance system killer protein/predicted XRE-type DNA-binding protein|nr:virulence protein RhuM/Fic/DOC family protein [Candidatus Portnoybacteria bacterium]MDD5752417.1 virulence protein RhuM/Fic/DOC family protein [Candidatus Portnoybacteria bacterium]HNU96818.1 virulence protein RhuM/Fic/DOC family protein [Candidatus Portnoybacteria bacterium]HOZ16508.1 virulence protein RhuM/Fic/DOC family protein [Candidatus Portnoybacteria bacterium]HPH52268.1 virulence protein RhuM/Fic/DOC family protein [Candidatus Portnoybacteria bacterium]
MNNDIKKGEIIIYKSTKGPEIQVKLEKETVWLTQKQVAFLFNVNVPAISKHIRNIFKDGELNKNSTISKMEIVQKEGNRFIKRNIEFFNLDLIISIGYRVNSQRATQFRIWATKTLKQHLLKGYTINEKRLLETKEKFNELQNTIKFLQEKSQTGLLQNQAGEILNLLSGYTKTLSILSQYDQGDVLIPQGKKVKTKLQYKTCKEIIDELRRELINKKEAGDLFGSERNKSFEGIIKGLYQTFSGKELYKTIEEKASHLLYLTIKDHPFSDGNKRIASFLFIYFLDKNYYLYRETGERKINDNALVALALLIAVSNPKEKDVMIKIIMNLLK